MSSITIGTRDSKLALIQTNYVKAQLEKEGVSVELLELKTKGDLILNKPLSSIGDVALFTKELDNALLDRRTEMAVHSLKDVPTSLPEGICIACITKRENDLDALVLPSFTSEKYTIDTLPKGSVLGTSSLRRIAQLKHFYPHLEFKSVRGNIQTRLAKLDDNSNGYCGLILAVSGLQRLQLDNRISQIIPTEICYPAVGQGALAVTIRQDDDHARSLLSKIEHIPTLLQCVAERSLLRELGGGCQAPIAVLTTITSNNNNNNNNAESNSCDNSKQTLRLHARVFSLDGKEKKVSEASIEIAAPTIANKEALCEQARELGIKCATHLLSIGADKILQSIRGNNK